METTAAMDEAYASRRARLDACLHRLEQVLPAQAPIRDFVHHNTLHGFQHLPFEQALAEAGRLTGATPWLDEARCRELLAAGRIDAADLDAALREGLDADLEEAVWSAGSRVLTRREVLLASFLQAIEPIPASRLAWEIDEGHALDRLPAGVPETARRRFLASAGLAEAPAVAELWRACRALARPSPPAGETSWVQAASGGWDELAGRLGHELTLSQLLQRLTGEALPAARPTLLRHLAAHLDQGLAAWRNPARPQGFYAAWRQSAAVDWAWALDDLPLAQREIERLPADPYAAAIGELERLGPAEERWPAYLERLALDLPGWSGMFLWRHRHPGYADAGGAPVDMIDCLAVRLVLERLYAEDLVRRTWQLPLSALGDHFLHRPAELWLRQAWTAGELPEPLLPALEALLRAEEGADGAAWDALAQRFAAWRQAAVEAAPAWPLFRLAQQLGLAAPELLAAGSAGAAALLACAGALDAHRRGYLWLQAFERHYREEVFAALSANHGRWQAPAAAPEAQLVFCMDDREEGVRRHLEELNPALETYGAAGFFGVSMRWRGIDDAHPIALCPVVVQPAHEVREGVPPGREGALAAHRRRRQRRLKWQARLYQGTRRGVLSAALTLAAAAPLALVGLAARSLAPARFGAAMKRWREAFELPLSTLSTTLALTAPAAAPAGTPQAPRAGFDDDEQAERIAAALNGIGLTGRFAPLVLIVGHGSGSENNPHLSAYDCGACSGRHGGPNARVFAAMANRPEVRRRLAERGIAVPAETWFVGAERNTCDDTVAWYDTALIPASHREAFARLAREFDAAQGRHAVERCRRFASAPREATPAAALRHVSGRRHDFSQARPELGHANIAAAFIGRRAMSRGAFFDRRVFLISYDPLPDADGRMLETTLLAAGPVGAGISLEYYFSTVDNERFGCGTKTMHNIAGFFGVMEGAASDLRTGLPRQMIEVHEPMRLLVVVEQTPAVAGAIYERQPALRELIGQGWILLAAQDPDSGAISRFDPARGWRPWAASGLPAAPVAQAGDSLEWCRGRREPLPPALLTGRRADAPSSPPPSRGRPGGGWVKEAANEPEPLTHPHPNPPLEGEGMKREAAP